jgi:hypothetical protein
MADYPMLRKPWLCPKCMSFWFGVVCSILICDPFYEIGAYYVVSNIFCGLVTHFVTCILVDKEII